MKGFRSAPFLFLLSIPLLLRGQPAVEIDWQYEIDLLVSELVKRHVDLFAQADSSQFKTKMDQIAVKAYHQSLFGTSVQLQQALVSLGDAQTRINYHFNIDSGSILPLYLYWFEDGLYVLRTRVDYREILGNRILAINGHPLEQVTDSLKTLLVNDNPNILKSELPRMITWTPLLEYFGFSSGSGYAMEYLEEDGHRGKVTLYPQDEEGEETAIETDFVPLYRKDRKAYFWGTYSPDNQIYYIQYNKCWSREAEETYGTGASALFMPSFKEFEKVVFRELKQNEIRKLVFDLRFNDGGNPNEGTRFIRKMQKALKKKDSEVFVIIGRETSNEALIHVLDLMLTFDAVLVGEGTTGKPNHFGAVKRFVLPESRLVVNHSSHYYQLTDQEQPSILPDVEALLYYDDYAKGRDPAMETIRSLEIE